MFHALVGLLIVAGYGLAQDKAAPPAEGGKAAVKDAGKSKSKGKKGKTITGMLKSIDKEKQTLTLEVKGKATDYHVNKTAKIGKDVKAGIEVTITVSSKGNVQAVAVGAAKPADGKNKTSAPVKKS
jgi:hypothetical protein